MENIVTIFCMWGFTYDHEEWYECRFSHIDLVSDLHLETAHVWMVGCALVEKTTGDINRVDIIGFNFR